MALGALQKDGGGGFQVLSYNTEADLHPRPAPPALHPRPSQWLTCPSSEGAQCSLGKALQSSSQNPAGVEGPVLGQPRACQSADRQWQGVAGCPKRPFMGPKAVQAAEVALASSGADLYYPVDGRAPGQGPSPQRGQLRALHKQTAGPTTCH